MLLMKFVLFRSTPPTVLALSLIAGCGGGSGSSNVQGALHQGSAGIDTFSYQGNPKPLITASTGQITSVTMAGASFTNLALHPNANLSNTDLIWSMAYHGADELYKLNYPNGSVQTLTGSSPGYGYPTQSKFGSIYCTVGQTLGGAQMLIDGTHVKSIADGGQAFGAPSVNPAGTTLAFQNAAGALYTCPAAGGTAILLQTTANAFGTSWSPTGTSIAFIAPGNGSAQVWTTPSTGGTPTDITPSTMVNIDFESPSWSPNGLDIAVSGTLDGNNSSIFLMSATLNTIFLNTSPSANSDFHPAFSPDGSKIAFYRSSTGGATAGIYTEDITGLNQQLIAALPATPDTLYWSPFPSPVTFVPNSSFYAGAVSGFIQTQNGSQFGSLLGFVATTPADATISSSSNPGYEPLIFTLSADAITNVVYTNAYFSYATTVTPPASTPTALVTVDATTGAVDMVATAAKPQTKFKPSTRSIGSNLIYDGPFTAVYGPKGNRLDTSGANQIVVDGKTGKLISWK